MLQKLGLDEATSRNDILVPIRLVADFEAASRVAIPPAMWLSYSICFGVSSLWTQDDGPLHPRSKEEQGCHGE